MARNRRPVSPFVAVRHNSKAQLLGCHSNDSTLVRARIKAYCDPQTGVARMPTTDIAKRWHCGVQMRDSGATALPEARETCTRNTRHRRFLNLNHNGNGTYHVSVSISVSKCRPNALREKTSARAKPSLMRFGSIHLRMPCD